MSDFISFRSRNRFQRAGVSDAMVRLKDMIISIPAPALTVPVVPVNSVPHCYVIDAYITPGDLIAEGLFSKGVQYGTLKWRSNSNYGKVSFENIFRERFRDGFILNKFTNINY